MNTSHRRAHQRPTARTALVGLLATATLTASALAVSAPASGATGAARASTSTAVSTTGTDDLRPRLELACRRIPNLEIRTERLLERLGGDVGVLGSIAWLEHQIERATEAGRDELVTVLQNRLEVRRAYVPVLEQRLELLDRLADTCRGFGIEP